MKKILLWIVYMSNCSCNCDSSGQKLSQNSIQNDQNWNPITNFNRKLKSSSKLQSQTKSKSNCDQISVEIATAIEIVIVIVIKIGIEIQININIAIKIALNHNLLFLLQYHPLISQSKLQL